jgi:tRNA-dihydrouridine synthase
MIGRGLIGDPGMLTPGGTTVPALESFLDTLLDCYQAVFGSARNAMFRMKENWHLLLPHFENSEKLGKRLRKTTDVAEYRMIVRQILHSLPLTDELQPDW